MRIVDREPTFPVGSRAKGVQPRTLELLDDLGVVDEILRVGRTRVTFRHFRGREVIRETTLCPDDAPTAGVPYPCGVLIPQTFVEHVLRERLASFGPRVELDTALTAIDATDHAVRATLATRDGRQEQIEVDYLVGCDGGRSFVRKALAIPFAGETHETERALIGDVRVDGLVPDAWHMWLDVERGLGFALCPLPGTDVWQFQGPQEEDANGALTSPSVDAFQSAFDRYAGIPGVRLHDATWLSTYRVNVRMAERFRVGRVFLAGDAAHVHSIAGGLGMNTGMQDAYNLGWKLAAVLQGHAGAGLLESYDAERLPIAAWTLNVTSARQEEVIAAARAGHGGIEAGRSGDTTQLSLNYRWSALSRETVSRSSGLRAGDRAPDVDCGALDTGATTRLFDIFRGPHFTLLAFGGGSPASRESAASAFGGATRVCSVVRSDADARHSSTSDVVLADSAGEAHRAYGVDRDTLVLVRPDGYVGLIAAGDDAAAVDEYFGAL